MPSNTQPREVTGAKTVDKYLLKDHNRYGNFVESRKDVTIPRETGVILPFAFKNKKSMRELIVAVTNFVREKNHMSVDEVVGALSNIFETEGADLNGSYIQLSSEQANRIAEGLRKLSAVPRTWEELKALIPSIKSWSEYRTANPEQSIIDYLADPDGLGRWTLNEPGVPRYLLKVLYFPINKESPLKGSPYVALANWLKGRDHLGNPHKIPDWMYLPTKSEETDRLDALAQTTGERPARVDWALRARALTTKSR